MQLGRSDSVPATIDTKPERAEKRLGLLTFHPWRRHWLHAEPASTTSTSSGSGWRCARFWRSSWREPTRSFVGTRIEMLKSTTFSTNRWNRARPWARRFLVNRSPRSPSPDHPSVSAVRRMLPRRFRGVATGRGALAWTAASFEPGPRFLVNSGAGRRGKTGRTLGFCGTGAAAADKHGPIRRCFCDPPRIENPRVGSSILSLGTEFTAVSRGFERERRALGT